MLLLHEMLEWLIERRNGRLEEFCTLPQGSGQHREHLDFCKNLGIPPEKTVAVGQHGDGVPFQKDQSLEVLSWNLIGCLGLERVFYACIEKNMYVNADALADVQ